MNLDLFHQKSYKIVLLCFDCFFAICTLFFIYFYYEYLSSFAKTLFAVLNLDKKEYSFIAFVWVSFYFAVFLIFLFFLYNLVKSILGIFFSLEEKYYPSVTKKYFIVLLSLLCFFFLSFILGKNTIYSSNRYNEYVSGTKKIIDNLKQDQSFSNVSFYVEHVPYLFEKKYNVKSSVLPLNYLNNGGENIIFTDSTNNYYLLNYQGYSYTRVSNELSIYTNSKKVIDFLCDNGYEVKPYYVYSEDISFNDCAKLNNITLDHNGFILLDKNNPEVMIPPLSLYAGNYQFDFDFELIESLDNESDLFEIESSFDFGKTDYQLVTINRKEFTNNKLFKSFKKNIPNKEGLMFRIVLRSNSHLLIKHFTITKY